LIKPGFIVNIRFIGLNSNKNYFLSNAATSSNLTPNQPCRCFLFSPSTSCLNPTLNSSLITSATSPFNACLVNVVLWCKVKKAFHGCAWLPEQNNGRMINFDQNPSTKSMIFRNADISLAAADFLQVKKFAGLMLSPTS
jgi:hypothetical protein